MGSAGKASSWIRKEARALSEAASHADPVGELYAFLSGPEGAPDRSQWGHEESFEWVIALSMCCAALEDRLSQARGCSGLSKALSQWGAPARLVERAREAERERALLDEMAQLESACERGGSGKAKAL